MNNKETAQADSQIQSTQLKSTKKNNELIFKTTFFFIISGSIFLLHKVYLYQTSKHLTDIRKGHIYDLVCYGLPFSVLFIVGELIMHRLFDEKFVNHYLDHQKFTSSISREKRTFLDIKLLWNFVYYLFSIVAGYIVIKDTSMMPEFMGGVGQCTQVSRYINNLDQANFQMKLLYSIQFGRHFAKLIQHCFIRQQGNYYQFALHHGLSTFLIFFSYLINMWLIGIFVLFIHDLSDAFLIISRVSRDYRKVYEPLLLVTDIIGGFFWFSCRIFLLSYCCVYASIYTIYQMWNQSHKFKPEIVEIIHFPVIFMAFMLFALQTVQILWTYYILCGFGNSKNSRKVQKESYQ